MTRRKQPPRVSRSWLQWHAMRHLSRYAATRAHLRRLLWRRVERSLAIHGGDRDQAAAWLDDVLDEMVRSRFLNDAAYAASKAATWLKRGVPQREIQRRLREKGVSSEIIAECLDEQRARVGDPQLRAACAYVRRRRLGPYRTPEAREELRQKDLARLGRAGFPYGLARRVLDFATVEEVEEHLRGERTVE